MAHYEMMCILDPSQSDEKREASLHNLKDIFEKHHVTITKEDIWGEKKLAYMINKSEKGYYVLFELELDGKNIKAISKLINLDRSIWRYMFVAPEA